MSVDALIFWLFVVAWAVIIGLLVFTQLPRVVGNGLRVAKHVMRLLDNSPVNSEIVRAQADVARIQHAAARAPALRLRAQAALTSVRTVPLVPPEVADLRRRVQFEVAAFRASR